MAATIIYEVRRLEHAWAVCLHGSRIVSFGHCERALRIAEVIARHHFRAHGTPVKVCLTDGERVLEVGPVGQHSQPAQAMAWLRHVLVLHETGSDATASAAPRRQA